MSLVPEKVNSEVAKADLNAGFALTGEIVSEEDKGYRIGLGLAEDVGGEGWISREEAGQYVPGTSDLQRFIDNRWPSDPRSARPMFNLVVNGRWKNISAHS